MFLFIELQDISDKMIKYENRNYAHQKSHSVILQDIMNRNKGLYGRFLKSNSKVNKIAHKWF